MASAPEVKHRFFTLDVFTESVFGGNQLAVLPDARDLSTDVMQRIAREFNYSESVFVLPPENPAHTKKVRIFTPGSEIPFAGHPTVGTAFLLAAIGDAPHAEGVNRIVLEEGVGPVRVDVTVKDGKPVFAQLSVAKLPERGPEPPPRSEIAVAVSLKESDLVDDGVGPAVFSCGLPFLFVRLRDVDAVRRAEIDIPAWKRSLAGFAAPDVFVFARGDGTTGYDVHARMFAPAFGIPEDPATGSACAALAGYIAAVERPPDGTAKAKIAQGVEMGRPSVIYLEADIQGGKVTAVRVGGSAVIVSEGTIDVPI